MIVKGEATYFDGITSRARQTLISYDSASQLISFSLEDEKFVWKTENCIIQVVKGKLEIHLNQDTSYFESHDANLAEVFVKTAPTIKSKNVFHRLLHAGFKVHLAILGFIFVLLGVMVLYVMPFVAEKSVALVPTSFDEQIGRSAYNDMLIGETINPNKSKLVQDFADQMKLQNTRKIHFTVVESSMVNAFALPNGEVIIYTGILNKLNSYPELAALIGHEVSHVNYRHSMKALSRNLSTYIFVSAILGDVNGVLTILGQNAAELQNLSYSRDLEDEADRMGLSILRENRINPTGFIDLFSTLNKNNSLEIPEFLSSHPVTTARISVMKKRIKEMKYTENSALNSLFQKIQNTDN